MLVIRDEQMSAFQREARRAFEDRAIAILTADYPDPCARMTEADLRQWVGRAIAQGTAHGIVTEGGVLTLLALQMQYGAGFERSPDRGWACRLLADPLLPGPVKVELLCQRLAGRSRGRVVKEL